MLILRPASERGRANFRWLDSKHTFSFGCYYDPEHMGFSRLRVINEDQVSPGKGFGTHSHQDMEIIFYVLAGELKHQDSIGNGSVIRPGDVQRMSAGTGIAHSEFNPSATDPVYFLQIWILPNRPGIPPSYEQKHFPLAEKQGKLRLVASPDGQDNSVTLHQDAYLYVSVLQNGDRLSFAGDQSRSYWLQVASGAVSLKDQPLAAGDGAAIIQTSDLVIMSHADDSEVLLFDLP